MNGTAAHGQRTIGVTGAGGQLGGAVLARLRALAPAGTRLCAMTRIPSRAEGVAAQADEVRAADFDMSRDALASAFRDIHTLLLVSIEGEDEQRIRLHEQAVKAAAQAGVARIVYTSFFDVAPESPSLVARVHRLTEEAVMESGCAWTLLRNGPYVDNVALRIAASARSSGVFPMAAGDSRLPFIARADLAEAAASALLAGSTGNAAFRLAGPELLSYQDLAGLVGAAVGRPVRYLPIDDDAYRAELEAEGVPPLLQARRIAYVRAMRDGFMTALTDDFERLVGRPPQRMREALFRLDLGAPPTH